MRQSANYLRARCKAIINGPLFNCVNVTIIFISRVKRLSGRVNQGQPNIMYYHFGGK